MTTFDAFRFDGKRALVVGGATGMGAAAAELLQSAGADVVVMDFADVTLAGATAIHVNLAEKDSIDAALEQLGRSGARAAVVRRRGRRHARHREDQLHRPPAPHRPAPGRGPAPPWLGHRLHLVGRRARLGVQPPPHQGVPGHPRLRQCRGLDRGQRRRRLHVDQAGHLRLRRHAGHAHAAAGHPHQRHLPRPDRHPAGPGQQGDVARLRGRLPRRGRRGDGDPARAGLPAGVPVQRGGLGHQRDHHGHRLRLLRRRRDRGVPARHGRRQLPAGPLS